jgi:toxin ParE1/3/4
VKPVRYHPEALEEYEEAIKYYADIDRPLGTRCKKALQAARSKFRRRPMSYPLDDDTGCHEYAMPKLPYSVHYLVLDEHIWIVAVAHHKRKLGYWRRRLRDL